MARTTHWERFKAFWLYSRWRSLVATILALGIMLAFVMTTWAFNREHTINNDWAAIQAVEFGQTQLAPGQSGITVYGIRPIVDFAAATVMITWMPYACGGLNVEQTGCSRRFTRAVDFFVDNTPNATYTLDPAWIPRATEDVTNYIQLQSAWTFPYTHNFRAGTWDSHLDLTYYYPSDSLNSTTIFRATDTVTGQPIPVLHISIPESPTGYKVSGWDFDVFLNATSTSRVSARWMGFTFFRTNTVKAFASIILVVNWGLTLIVMHITIYYVMEGGRVEIPREILLLPVSVILTVPQLRDAMPDVPRFGIMIDIVGYFFNLIVIALCSFTLILILIYQERRAGTALPSPAHAPHALPGADPGLRLGESPRPSSGYIRHSGMDPFDAYMHQHSASGTVYKRQESWDGAGAIPYQRRLPTDGSYQLHQRQSTVDPLIESKEGQAI